MGRRFWPATASFCLSLSRGYRCRAQWTVLRHCRRTILQRLTQKEHWTIEPSPCRLYPKRRSWCHSQQRPDDKAKPSQAKSFLRPVSDFEKSLQPAAKRLDRWAEANNSLHNMQCARVRMHSGMAGQQEVSATDPKEAQDYVFSKHGYGGRDLYHGLLRRTGRYAPV